MRNSASSQINFIVMLTPWFQLSYCCTCHSSISCDLINLAVYLYKYFKRVNISALLQCLIQQQYSNSQTVINLTKHSCKRDIFWSYSLLLSILFQFLNRICNLIIKRVCTHNYYRYYCWARKLQKLGLAHYTCYMVTNENTCLLKMDYFSSKNKILVNFMSDGLIHKIYINNFKLSPINDILCLHTTSFATLVIQISFEAKVYVHVYENFITLVPFYVLCTQDNF